MKQRKILVLIVVLLLLAGCAEKPHSTVWEGELPVYYVNGEENGLISVGHISLQAGGEAIAKELLRCLKSAPNETCLAAIPETVALPAVVMGTNGLLTLQFDETYGTVTGLREVLMRAAIVKTLCETEEIDSVEFYVAGQPLLDSKNTPIGIMKSEDFIDSTGPASDYYRYVYAKVYYANKKGDGLVASNLKIPYVGSETEEQVVLRQLIAGPIEEDMYPVLSEGTRVLDVSNKDGVCTVNFDSAFLERPGQVSEEVVIYSVVNTLAELPGIYRVQFLVNGEQKKTYDDMDLTLSFERNLGIIEKE